MNLRPDAKPNERSLTVFLLSMMTLVILYGIENAATMAQIGWGLITAYLLAAIFILLPVGLVSAELGSGSPPHDGGLYFWVREAFGPRIAFFALFQQWIAWVFTIPTVFTFVAVSATYIFNPNLQDNQVYTALVVIAITVIATGLNLFGVRKSGIVSVLSIIFLVIIPTVVILALAINFIARGGAHTEFSASELWIFDNSAALGWMIAGINSFLGLEMSAYFLKRLRDPQKQFPLVLIIAGTLAFVFLTLLTLAVFLVTPAGSVSLTAGIMETITTLFESQNLAFLVPIIAAIIAIGGLLKSSTVVLGPATGLFASAQYGHLPAKLTKVNKRGAPVSLLVVQGIIVLFATLAFVVFKSVETTFFLLLTLSVIPYMLAYFCMFAAAIRLRYKQPQVRQDFRVPGGKVGIWVVCGLGFVASLAVLIEGAVPQALAPDQKVKGAVAVWVVMIVVCIAPFLIDRNKPSKALDEEVDAQAVSGHSRD
ncbi:MAG: amino acid transporter [Actinomycetes bacterium]|jgi:amino acid transporter